MIINLTKAEWIGMSLSTRFLESNLELCIKILKDVYTLTQESHFYRFILRKQSEMWIKMFIILGAIYVNKLLEKLKKIQVRGN